MGLVAALAVPQSAAASGELELSDDGITFGSSLPTPLFDGLSSLVPLQSDSEIFYVRNAGAEAAYLRITLDNATWTSAPYAASLAVTASVPGKSGAPVLLSAATGCSILLEGSRIESGETVAVTTTVALGNLVGSNGQDATASMDLGLTLVQAVGPAEIGCGTPAVIVPAGHRPTSMKPRSEQSLAVTPEQTPEQVPEQPSEQLEGFPVFFNTVSGGGGLLLYAGVVLFGAAAYYLLPVVKRRRARVEVEEELP
jgi:hypothetical protein